MSLSIHTNGSAKTAINSLSKAGLANAKSSQRLSTGFRINSPADNAAGLQITNRMEKFLNSAGQAKQNIQESIAMLQIADGGLAESVKTLNAMKKLATQAANDTNSAADREAIQKEFSELGQELQNALNNTEYNAEKLFAAGGKMRKELNFQSGTDANSSLKLDLNKVIEELTESVTEERKKVTGTSASATGSLEKQAFDLNKATTKANTALKEAEILQEKITTNLTKTFSTSVDIPGYINAKGVPVAHEIIPSSTPINTGHLGKIQTAVAALRAMQQIALMGLLEALRRYGHPDGQFAAYAVHRIRGSILDQLREHDWRPRRLRQKTHKTNEAIRQIAKRLGHEPNFEEISAELNLTADEYQEYLLLENAGAMESLDEILALEAHNDILQSRDLEENIIIEDNLKQAISTLDEREQMILHLYYQQELSMKEIAQVLDLTEARICQLNKKLVQKIKSFY